MTAFFKKKTIQFAIAIGFALLGPVLIPPHGLGIYIPLGSLLCDCDIWRDKPGSSFFGVFLIELAVYSVVLYGIWRLALLSFKRGLAPLPQSTEHCPMKEQKTPVVPSHGTPDEKLAHLVKKPE
jgi:hypothetical protein